MTYHATHNNETGLRDATHTYMFVPIRHPHHNTICADNVYIFVYMYIYITPLFV